MPPITYMPIVQLYILIRTLANYPPRPPLIYANFAQIHPNSVFSIVSDSRLRILLGLSAKCANLSLTCFSREKVEKARPLCMPSSREMMMNQSVGYIAHHQNFATY